ncbi:MAG: hypothetical protein QF812_03040 [Nitrososphaerales archaeon]|jgi:hypothetical protein|nr:hypothetical protein [Nitrososphaerales archaeon]|tara:strand:+ start:316 stop:597 length:282 start_codon:yes stop_codon:yes gene_type:complete
MHLSPRRKKLRVLGGTLVLLGAIALLYAVFVMQSVHFYENPDPVPGAIEFNHRTFQAEVGFFGVILIIIGCVIYRFIPSSEKESADVDLNPIA